METAISQPEAARNPAVVAARVVADAKRAYASIADEASIERFARQAVEELMTEAVRIKTYVPVLAMRRVREMLDGQQTGGPVSTSS
jgi:hypothetical protein